MVAPLDACTLVLGAESLQGTCSPATPDNTPNPLSPAPPKPPVLDPPPQIVTVQAPAGTKPTKNKPENQSQQARDTGRG
jgi:hypothetical protein